MNELKKLNSDILPEPESTEQDDSIWNRLDGKLTFRLTNAYLFVAVLQKDNEALCSLIAALLHKKREEVVSVEIKNPIILGQEIDFKTCIMDLLVLLNNNIRINIEMQVNNEYNWDDRSVYYLSRKAADLPAGADYREMKPFYQIGILDFNFPADNQEFYQEIRLMNIKTHKIYSDKVSVHVLCLPMIENATEEDRASGLYFWAKVFQATTWKELKKLAEGHESFKKTVVTMAELTEDEKIRQMCLARDMYDRDMVSSHNCGYDMGFSDGFSDGEMKGFTDGINLLSQLSKKLSEAGRSEEISAALEDKGYLERLLEEFGLKEQG